MGSKTRSMRSAERIGLPIPEGDFQRLFELLRKKPPFREYVQRVCRLRMFILGYATEDEQSDERLYSIMDELGQKDVYGKFRLPEDFEAAREILVKMQEKKDLDRVLDETRSIV